MEVGKLPQKLLAELLSGVTYGERVVVGPSVGVDAAVLDFGERLLVAKTDPVTLASDLIGWYAVNVNANDIAAMGATPKWFLASILLPPGTSEEAAKELFDQTLAACRSLDIDLVGGHTEITYDLPRPIVVGCMLGETDRDRLVTASARVGDTILLTKGIAIEGTALLAREAPQALSGLDTERLAGMLFDPGISVVRDARVLTSAVRPTAMHDPTEGGVATGIAELAAASGLGVQIDRIPVLPETEAVCAALGLDPLGLIASGSLLATVSPADTERALSALADAGITAHAIGRMTEGGLKLGEGDLPTFERDEIARWFSKL
ncbi:MAG: AIR synthase family protein [Armatimonadota bacterium]